MELRLDTTSTYVRLICALLLALPVAAGERQPPKLYQKKATWAKTMVATRAAVLDAGRHARTGKLTVTLSPWKLAGPFPSTFDDDSHLPATASSKWKLKPAYKDGKVHDFGGGEKVSRYLQRTITADGKGALTASFGSDDGIKIWLNGKLLRAKNVGRAAGPDQEILELPLKQGKNLLVLKIHNAHAGSGFYFNRIVKTDKLYSDLARQFWSDFPHETDWFLQDNRVCRGFGLQAGFDARGDFEAYFANRDSAALENALIKTVLRELPQKMAATKLRPHLKPDSPALLRTYVSLCRKRRRQRLKPLLAKTNGVIFAKHQTFGVKTLMYLDTETDGLDEGRSSLNHIDLRPEMQGTFAKTTVLLDAGDGIVRDPELHFDAELLLFAWRKSRRRIGTRDLHATTTPNYQIYEYHLKTRKLRQLTDKTTYGASFEPCWLPNDDILFSSARIVQDITCGFGNCSNFFLMNKDGKYARRIGFDQTNTGLPALLHDGKVVYTRRDYNDRGQSYAHALFQMNPDGTGQIEYYGNNTVHPASFQHARPIPGTRKVLAIVGGYHTSQGGKLVIIDNAKADNGFAGLTAIPSGKPLTPKTWPLRGDWYAKIGDQYSTPYPIDTKGFLCSYDPIGAYTVARDGQFTVSNDVQELGKIYYKIYYMDYTGRRELLAADASIPCHQAIPVMKRKRPVVRPSLVNYKMKYGTMYVQNVYLGQSMKGIPKGTVRKLRVVEILYKPASFGGSDCSPIVRPHGGAGHSALPVAVPSATYDAKRILGDAVVHADGSAMFKVPARRPVYLQALDKNGRVIQTMRSWATLMPGENLSCVGCHEKKTDTPQMPRRLSVAMKKGPEPLADFYGPARGFSFAKEVQPILDRHCIGCHAPGKKMAKLDLTNRPVPTDCSTFTPGIEFHQSYLSLMNSKPENAKEDGLRDVSRGDFKYVKFFPRLAVQTLQPPYAFGSAVSPLMKRLDKNHSKVKLNREEREKIAAWIDLGAPFCGAYGERNTWTAKQRKFFRERVELRRQNVEIETRNIEAYINAGQPGR